jgi:uncharacterized protein (TIGR03435 family)
MSAMFRVFTAVFASAVAFGQSPESLTFEVASVKPAPVPTTGGVFFGPARGGPGTPDPGQITWSFVRLQDLLTTAYDVKPYQVSGPGWLATERYNVVAKVPMGATKEQVRVMWQNLIRERFTLVLHHESKEFQVEDLVIGKDGSKLKQSAEDPDAALLVGPPKRDKNGALDRPGAIATIFPGPDSHISTVAKSQPLSHLTNMLGNALGHPVIDKTGLTGKFDYTIDFKFVFPAQPEAEAAAPVASDPGPDIASAVQQQLGLKLVPGRAKLDVLVIDSAARVPTEN